jgi:methionyl-tRNA synthetase
MAEDGRKMSKSFGNVIDPNYLLDKYNADTVRYYFMKEFIIENDNNFNENKLIELFNSDLANIFGNIVSRLIGMLNLYSNRVVPQNGNESSLSIAKDTLLNKIESEINQFDIRRVLNSIVDFGKEINLYIESSKP